MSLQDEIADEYLPDINVNGMDCPDTESAKDIINKVLDAAVKSMESERNLENDSDESQYSGVLMAKISYNYAIDQMINTVNKLRPES